MEIETPRSYDQGIFNNASSELTCLSAGRNPPKRKFLRFNPLFNNKGISRRRNKYGNEVDFVILENGKPKALYHSCYDLADFETKEREIKNLKKAGRKLNCRELILVARQGDESLKKLEEIEIVSSEMFLE